MHLQAWPNLIACMCGFDLERLSKRDREREIKREREVNTHYILTHSNVT